MPARDLSRLPSPLRRRVTRDLAVRAWNGRTGRWAFPLGGALWLAASGLLVLRATVHGGPSVAAVASTIAWPLVACVVLVWARARASAPQDTLAPPTRALAELDRDLRAGGVLMALGDQAMAGREMPTPEGWWPRWEASLERLPAVSRRWRPWALPASGALAMVLASLVASPGPSGGPGGPRGVPFEVAAAGIEAQLDALDALGALPADEREALEAALAEARERADDLGGMDAGSWRALDSVDARLERQAVDAALALAEAQAAAEALQARLASAEGQGALEVPPGDGLGGGDDGAPRRQPRDRLARRDEAPPASASDLAARAERGRRLLERLTRPRVGEGERALAEALRELAEGLEGLGQGPAGAEGELGRDDPEMDALMQELAELLREQGQTGAASEATREGLQRGAGETAGGGRAATAEDLRRIIEALRRRLEDGEAAMSEAAGAAAMSLALRLVGMGGACAGGTGGGGGAAPLTRDGRELVVLGGSEALPRAETLDLERGVVVGETARSADDEDAWPQDPGADRAAASELAPARGDARPARIAPRHRAAVDRYFAP